MRPSLKRRALKRLGFGPFGRIWAGAALQATATLVRRHPRAALHAFTAGLGAARRDSLEELRALRSDGAAPRPFPKPAKRLGAGERRRLRAFLEAAERRERADCMVRA